MIRFTHDCTGDLGVKVGDRVVAQWFYHQLDVPSAARWHVYDLVQGGPRAIYFSQDAALNAMLSIAEREAL